MNKNIIIVLVFILLAGGAIWHFSKNNTPKETSEPTDTSVTTEKDVTPEVTDKKIINTKDDNTMKATIHTSKGDITVALSPETAPKTVENFTKLAKDKFYDGIKFHRVIEGFMIQAGDPLTKDDSKKDYWGTGGPGYKFADELSGKETYPQGTLAMANAGPNTNGSQFFIVTASPEAQLPPSYTVFGHVVDGMDVALAIEKVATEGSDRPVDAITIKNITLQ